MADKDSATGDPHWACSLSAIAYTASIFGIGVVPMMLNGSILIFLIFWFVFQVYPSIEDTIRLIDFQIPNLEHSSQLLQNPASNDLQRIQLKRISSQLDNISSTLKWPLPWSMVAFVSVVTIISVGTYYLIRPQIPEKMVQDQIFFNSADSTSDQISDSLFLTDIKLRVNPPDYTGGKSYASTAPDVKVLEGSTIKIISSYNLEKVTSQLKINNVIFNGTRKPDGFHHDFSAKDHLIYQLSAKDDFLHYESPYHIIEIIPDAPPDVKVLGIPQYQRFDWEQNASIIFNIDVGDDHGLTETFLSITLTEGDGESIRFREQRIDLLEAENQKKLSLSYELSGGEFNMHPGNELYFHVEARDNHPGRTQITRSNTYFFAINDTSEVAFSLAGDLGADIMPTYFKSQLQLIIDTEKLIAESGKLPKEVFNSESNELAYEQKQLRLRYGQFMGEEDDSGLELTSEVMEESESLENHDHDHDHQNLSLLQRFGHDHDHENETGQFLDRGTDPHAGHDHEEEEGEEDPLKAFLHLHEDEETATFYTVSLKAKLRSAMNEMWDAELYLRMYRPAQSLPYQYKALKLLKEIKNHARIYVQRVGFEPTPINEQDARLTKTPENLSTERKILNDKRKIKYPGIHDLIKAIERNGYTDTKNISTSTWTSAGNDLAQLSIENPGSYLYQLNAIQLLQNNDQNDSTVSNVLQRLVLDLSSIVKEDITSPGLSGSNDDDLEDAYWKALKKLNR
jgi:hypothetical protein